MTFCSRQGKLFLFSFLLLCKLLFFSHSFFFFSLTLMPSLFRSRSFSLNLNVTFVICRKKFTSHKKEKLSDYLLSFSFSFLIFWCACWIFWTAWKCNTELVQRRYSVSEGESVIDKNWAPLISISNLGASGSKTDGIFISDYRETV